MKYAIMSILTVLLQLFTSSATAQLKIHSDVIEVGDYIFVLAGIIGCGNKRYVVEYVKAESEVTANFLDRYDLQVVGTTASRIQEVITKRIFEDTGREPKTITIVAVPASNENDIFRFLQAVVEFRNTDLNCKDRKNEAPVKPYIDWPTWDDYASRVLPNEKYFKLLFYA
jgi:hypothetical protein